MGQEDNKVGGKLFCPDEGDVTTSAKSTWQPGTSGEAHLSPRISTASYPP